MRNAILLPVVGTPLKAVVASLFLIRYSDHMNVVIMAGGGGTRLWPLSRGNKPKQFLDLGTGKTLLEHTWERARTVAEPSAIYVATTQQYVEQVRQFLPELSADHIFIEAERRDTGPAIAAVALQLQKRGYGAEPVVFMWSDHYFTEEESFIADLKKLNALIQEYPEHIIILGHRPSSPETTLGYIELGEEVREGIFQVKAFKEKPNEETAQAYVAAGTYAWNMAYVSSTPNYILAELSTHAPELSAGLERLGAAKNDESAAAVYKTLPTVAIDYVLLEKTPRLLAVVGDYGWSDVGGWPAVKEVFGKFGDHMPLGHHLHIDSDNNYIYNATDRAVTLLGVHNAIVVVTEDAVLVSDQSQAHRVKEIISRLQSDNRYDLL